MCSEVSVMAGWWLDAATARTDGEHNMNLLAAEAHASQEAQNPSLAADSSHGRREDFDFGGLLGRGSYACVYEARSRHSGQSVALKVRRVQVGEGGSLRLQLVEASSYVRVLG